MLHARDKRGRTSLMLASANGHLDMVTLLIGQGADINAVDKVFIRITFNHEFPNSNACFGTHLTRTKDVRPYYNRNLNLQIDELPRHLFFPIDCNY